MQAGRGERIKPRAVEVGAAPALSCGCSSVPQSPGCRRQIHKIRWKDREFLVKGQQHLTTPNSSTELLQAEEDFSCRGRLEQWSQPVLDSAWMLGMLFGAVRGRGALWGLSLPAVAVQMSQSRRAGRQSLENPLGELQSPVCFGFAACLARGLQGAEGARHREGSRAAKSCWLHRFFLRSQETSDPGGGGAPGVLGVLQLLSGSADEGHSESQNGLGWKGS